MASSGISGRLWRIGTAPSAAWRGERLATVLMLLAVYLACIVIDPGQLGFDTSKRLQVTHWLWTSADSILDTDKPIIKDGYDTNIAIGANGQAHYGYGIGQSLAMLPADVIATAAAHFVADRSPNAADITYRIRRTVVSYVTFPLIAVLTALAMRQFFMALGLDAWTAVWGVLLCFAATRWLDISQSHQETSLHFCCLLTGALCLLRWRATALSRYAWGAGAAFFIMVITRVVSVVDIAILCGGFALLMAYEGGAAVFRRLAFFYARIGACVAAGLIVDRVYHFVRFGEWTSTYAGLYFKRVAEIRLRSPTPLEGAYNDPSFPWTVPLWDGVAGALVSPKWGLLWFDSLTVLAVYLFVRFFGRWDRPLRACFAIGVAHLCAYALFYGRYYEPAGWSSWGDRYVEVPAIFLSMLAIFMLLKTWSIQNLFDRLLSLSLCAASVIVQVSSAFFYYSLEIAQFYGGCGSRWIVIQRFRNIATFLRGRQAGSDCVSAEGQWVWDPYPFAGAMARTVAKTVAERQLLWSVWGAGLLAVIALVGCLLAIWRQSAVHEPSEERREGWAESSP